MHNFDKFMMPPLVNLFTKWYINKYIIMDIKLIIYYINI